jgi:uncharacterized protein YbaP (TraB family)
MHARDDRAFRLAASLYPRIEACDRYVGEMELTGEPARIQHDFRISGAFPARAYSKMQAQLQTSFGLDIGLYDRVHPVAVMGMLAHRVLAEDRQVSLDEHLWAHARDKGIPVGGLESVDEQLAILAAIDPLPVCRQLRQLARRPEGLRRQTARMIGRYAEGDMNGLYRMTRASLHGLRRPVLYARNACMVRRIIGLDPTRATFIAVGAAHLGGRFGIIAGLKRLGWRVRAVRLENTAKPSTGSGDPSEKFTPAET